MIIYKLIAHGFNNANITYTYNIFMIDNTKS